MTDFEKTKVKLHILVENLSETSLMNKIYYATSYSSYQNNIDLLKHILETCQKEKELTLEEKLQELGFKPWEHLISGLNYLTNGESISIRYDSYSSRGAVCKFSRSEEKLIIKCAKFLKELANEN
jgi:hypothetical protein